MYYANFESLNLFSGVLELLVRRVYDTIRTVYCVTGHMTIRRYSTRVAGSTGMLCYVRAGQDRRSVGGIINRKRTLLCRLSTFSKCDQYYRSTVLYY